MWNVCEVFFVLSVHFFCKIAQQKCSEIFHMGQNSCLDLGLFAS